MALVLCPTALLPLIAIRGKWSGLLPLLGACTPVFAWGVIYYLVQHGTIILNTWRK